ncbi:MAG: ABC transporter permease [Burkholderiales bacterium]|nr:ABC transporter permease [Burkholderiales bacterium]
MSATDTTLPASALANIREPLTQRPATRIFARLTDRLIGRVRYLLSPLTGLMLPLAMLVAWEAVVRLGWVSAHQLPPPSTLAATTWELARSGSLFQHAWVSSLRVLAGFLIGASLALLIGSLVALVRPAERLLDPTFQGLRAVPSLAWVPLLLLWFGIDETPKLVLIAIGTFFPVYLATFSGLGNVDRKLVEVGRQAGLDRGAVLWRILLPAALPGIFTGLRAALSLGWMFLVAAELIASTQGLGYLLSDGRETGRVDFVFIAILSLALLGKLTDSLLRALEHRVLAWRDVADLQETSA